MTEKKTMKKTKPELTPEQRKKRAVEILQQAIFDAAKEGVTIRTGNHANGFVVFIPEYKLIDGNLEKCAE